MKKLLLIALSTASISANIYADESYYLGGDVGASFIQKTKIEGVKAKSKQASPSVSLTAGYYIVDNFRAEVNYMHFFDPKITTKNDSTTATSGKTVVNKSSQKFSVDTLLLNGYFDLFDVGAAKIFVGAGVGMASIKANGSSTQTTNNSKPSSQTQANNVVVNGTNVRITSTSQASSSSSTSTTSVSHKGKTSTNFAYNLIVGTAFEINEDVTFDFKYLFTDCGKAKKFENQKGGSARFRTHSLTSGFRFKL